MTGYYSLEKLFFSMFRLRPENFVRFTADFLNICFDASIKTDFDLIRKYDEY